MRSRVYKTVVRSSICLSVCPIMRPQSRRAAGLLLSAVRTGNIDQQLRRWARQVLGFHQQRRRSTIAARRSAANASSVTFTADVRSRTRAVCACSDLIGRLLLHWQQKWKLSPTVADSIHNADATKLDSFVSAASGLRIRRNPYNVHAQTSRSEVDCLRFKLVDPDL